MKQAFLATLVALVVLTALLAGVLSLMGGTPQPSNADAVDKTFFIGTSATQTFQRLLTPGQDTPCKFNVTNVDGEAQALATNMDLTIIVDCGATLETLPQLHVQLVEYLPDGTVQDINADSRWVNGVITYVRPAAFAAGRAETRAFGVVLLLTSSDAPQLARPAEITVQVAGTVAQAAK